MVNPETSPTIKQRLSLQLQGIVQGIGFRPFVYRLAIDLGLSGWVNNSSQGVTIEIEGKPAILNRFLQKLETQKPYHAQIYQIKISNLPLKNDTSFEIRPSHTTTQKSAVILPDLATCPKCLAEIFDPHNRRYCYPFTNCTHCGPRYSIIQALPYDRSHTTMQSFQMCEACQQEYDNPDDRRFHAQPNACSVCGPYLSLWDRQGQILAEFEIALSATAQAIREGQIVAVKGLGGFHLMVDARNENAVTRLRQRKHRPHKPLALMYPSLAMIQEDCEVSETEANLLQSPESPIVLLRRYRVPPSRMRGQTDGLIPPRPPYKREEQDTAKQPLASPLLKGTGEGSSQGDLGRSLPQFEVKNDLSAHRSLLRQRESQPIAPAVAPDTPYLGVMLPYTPLHHLLLKALGFPVVVTSGNLASEPLCTDNSEAVERLHNIADLFLVHNRPIAHSVDDSVVRVLGNQPTLLRRARGYAPLPLRLETALTTSSFPLATPIAIRANKVKVTHPTPVEMRNFVSLPPSSPNKAILAVGGHLKNTVALYHQNQILLSPHIGDLDTPETLARFQDTITTLQKLYDLELGAIAVDAHPNYQSTQFAQNLAQQHQIPCIPIQHHYAHILACLADNEAKPPVLGIAWDGTGYGLDNTIWGGEFLLIESWDNPQINNSVFPSRPLGEGLGVTASSNFQRVARFKPFPLPGGEKATREPRRCALGLLYACFGEAVFSMTHLAPLQAFSSQELTILKQMLKRRINTPSTSSVGRLFDGLASLLNLAQIISFEGQSAMQLEFLLTDQTVKKSYPLPILNNTPLELDWRPMIIAILNDIKQGVSSPEISAKFQHTLVQGIVAIAHHFQLQQVALTGGCFQNQYLLEKAVILLQNADFSPLTHRRLPPNDGSIAVGQILGSLRQLQASKDIAIIDH